MQIPATKVMFPDSDRAEILARIDRCLAEGAVAQGRNVEEFERGFAAYVGCRHAVAVNSGGSALEAGMRALDVKGKEVLVPTNTFLATASAVLAAGGSVRLLDIDPQTLSPDPVTVEAAVGPNTAGLIIVHVGGLMSPALPEIRALCARRGIWLFEDCAHAHGSALGDRKAGQFGIGGAYSFFSTKVMTCGEGGMVVTDYDQMATRVRVLRNYGKPEPWVTYCVELGMGWRLNELAAAVGVVQLRRLDQLVAWRARLAALYTARLADLTCLRPVRPHGPCSWYKYVAVLGGGVCRDEVKAFAKAQGVSMSGGVYDLPLHRQPVFHAMAARTFPNADAFCDHHLCLPLYFGMTDEEAEYVVQTVRKAVHASQAR